ncbi:MAG: prepilin-type N-terminal cleavage/methylation domain-containing protein [Armatimonadetes bacterium]|nr:prepilin-type N-terminal cleavage/methylation domain-containing protein [Armatimonadota bacterium]
MSVRRAFTLVEIMIVVLIMGVLLSIAIPQWVNARTTSRTNACVSNLHKIEDAKDQFAMANGLGNGAVVLQTDLAPLFLRSSFPSCPAGGAYAINPIGTNVTCTVANHVLP